MIFSDPIRTKRLIIVAGLSSLIAGLISGAHHWYGAVFYDTPWRMHVSFWIPGIALLVVSLLFVYWRYAGKLTGKIAIWCFFLGAVVFQTGFTLFECVYSHVLKNILFFGGVPRAILEHLFPSPTYHLPDNWIFELLGLLQIGGLVAAWLAYRVFKDRPWAHR